jgi:hypothetical protein
MYQIVYFHGGAPDDYLSLPYKFYYFFRNIEMDKEYDWYVFIDNDTFVYHDRLEKSLEAYYPNEWIVEGKTES